MGLGVLVSDPALARDSIAQAYSGEDQLVRWLAAANADGRLHVDNPDAAAELFWGMISGVLIWPHLLFGAKSESQVKAQRDEIISQFLHYYASRPD